MNWKFLDHFLQSKKAIACLLLTAGILLFIGLQKEVRVQTQVVKKGHVLQARVTPTQTPDAAIEKKQTKAFIDPTPQPEADRPLDETPATVMIQVTQMQQQAGNTQSKPVVHVSISGGNSFDLENAENANQCDVLTKAQAEGKIHDLVMKFDNNVGSYAVYKINGLGKDNQVWWVYSVNGQDASKGCSFINTNHGDQISWKYIGT